MSEHAVVKEEHRKLADLCIDTASWDDWDTHHEQVEAVAKLIADFARDERLKEAEWWAWHLTSVQMKTFGKDGITPEERIAQLKRGEV